MTTTDREPGRCRAQVLRNGYYTGRRCTRQATVGDYCKQHAAMTYSRVRWGPLAPKTTDAKDD